MSDRNYPVVVVVVVTPSHTYSNSCSTSNVQKKERKKATNDMKKEINTPCPQSDANYVSDDVTFVNMEQYTHCKY